MRKKILIILVAIAIFYIIIGVLLLSNIQFMESPDILVEIEVSEVDSEKAVLHTIMSVYNPNGFDIIAQNVKITTTTEDGYEVANASIDGGIIGSNENKTFIEDVRIELNGRNPGRLITKISGDVGVKVLFVEKTIPLKAGVVTNLESLLNDLAAPTISITIDIDDITTDNVKLSAVITAYNPNSFDLYLDNISAEIKTDTDEIVGNLDVSSGAITGKHYTDLNANGTLLLKAFNAKKLSINLVGTAGANIAGFEKDLPLDVTMIINIPDLGDILLPKENPTILAIKVNGKLTTKGFVADVELIINNTFKIDLALRNTMISLYVVDGENEKLLKNVSINEEIIVEAGTVKNVTRQIIVPFSKLLTSNLLSADYQMIDVKADITVRGINPTVYLEIKGYQDLHMIR